VRMDWARAMAGVQMCCGVVEIGKTRERRGARCVPWSHVYSIAQVLDNPLRIGREFPRNPMGESTLGCMLRAATRK
jgi:hypothetical protein